MARVLTFSGRFKGASDGVFSFASEFVYVYKCSLD